MPPSQLNIKLSQSSSNGYDLGFYFDAGTLGGLVANGLTITGTNFEVNLWLNPDSFTWNQINSTADKYTGLGSNGMYGALDPTTTGTKTINGATTYESLGGGCSATTVNALASGTCNGIDANTPVAIWVGVGPLSSANTVSASVAINPTLVFNGTANVINDADSGYNTYNGNNIWAIDSLTRTIKVWQISTNRFFANVSDVGTANIIAGHASPGNAIAIEPFNGFSTITGAQNVVFTANAVVNAPLTAFGTELESTQVCVPVGPLYT